MMEAVVSRLENHEAIPSAGNWKGIAAFREITLPTLIPARY
jgi:hypothetical protein